MRDDIVGGSLDRLRRQLPVLAREPGPIVLLGERGSGKSLFAAHIHAHRSAAPLVGMNCALLSERDRRIVLFGAEPPELTTTKRSVLEIPTTVLLKHVDRAEPYLQERLAASLTAMQCSRFGSSKTHPVAARLIFTLRQPVEAFRSSGSLHPPLARMLQRCRTLRIPPLRDRPGDLRDLARYYFTKFSEQHFRSGPPRGCDAGGDPALFECLKRQSFPDNVRDLMAFVRGLVPLSYEEELRQDAKFEVMKMLALVECGTEFSLPEALVRIEHDIVTLVADMAGGGRGEVARRLGLSERDVRRKLGRRVR